jgi:GrpB-like predicted nucleotidyltransferase (UPF0157 family)
MPDEDYLKKHTVGELSLLSKPVQVVDYDPCRPRRFESEAALIRSALGEQALRIEPGAHGIPVKRFGIKAPGPV